LTAFLNLVVVLLYFRNPPTETHTNTHTNSPTDADVSVGVGVGMVGVEEEEVFSSLIKRERRGEEEGVCVCAGVCACLFMCTTHTVHTEL